MAPPATPSPAAPRPSNRRAASCRPSCPESLQPLPFPSPIPSLARRYSTTSIGWRAIALAWGQPPSAVQAGQSPATTQLFMLFPERLDLYINTRRQIELHQRIDRLLRRLKYVEQALVGADLKLLPRLLVHVRRTQHAVFVLHRRQRNRTRNLRARTFGCFHDLARRLVQDAVVVSLQPDANSLFSNHCVTLLTPPGVSGKKELAAGSNPLLLVWRGHSCPRLPLTCCMRRGQECPRYTLLNNLGDPACADRVAAFANREPQALLHCHRRDQFNHQADVVARHHHLRARRQLRYACHVRRSQIKLRPVSLKEWRVPPALFLRQDVDLGLELGVRRNRSRLRQHHAALDVFFRNAAQQQASIVARHTFVQLL